MPAHPSDTRACQFSHLSCYPKRPWSSRRMRPPLRPPRPPRRRHTILFLAANPGGTTRLALDEECAAIERELCMAPGRDDFDFRSKWAVSVDEMMRHLNEWRPTIVHFSGHGSGGAGGHLRHGSLPARRDVEADAAAATAASAGAGAGLYLQDERRSQHVSEHALAKLIEAAAESARVVVLNTCFSDAAADALRRVVDCVVSMAGAIGDDAARAFAVGFYRALGHRRSIGNAVAQAIATLAAQQLPDAHLPVCRTRDGVSADRLVLPSTGAEW